MTCRLEKIRKSDKDHSRKRDGSRCSLEEEGAWRAKQKNFRFMGNVKPMKVSLRRVVEPKQGREMRQTKEAPRKVIVTNDQGKARRRKMPHPRNSPRMQQGALPCRATESSLWATHTPNKHSLSSVHRRERGGRVSG